MSCSVCCPLLMSIERKQNCGTHHLRCATRTPRAFPGFSYFRTADGRGGRMCYKTFSPPTQDRRPQSLLHNCLRARQPRPWWVRPPGALVLGSRCKTSTADVPDSPSEPSARAGWVMLGFCPWQLLVSGSAPPISNSQPQSCFRGVLPLPSAPLPGVSGRLGWGTGPGHLFVVWTLLV